MYYRFYFAWSKMKKLTYVYFGDKIKQNLLENSFLQLQDKRKSMNFRLRQAKTALIRNCLEKSDFYEDIIFENKVVSENGIVQKYTVTKIINEGEMHIIKKIFLLKN